jgi:hypothetical protein
MDAIEESLAAWAAAEQAGDAKTLDTQLAGDRWQLAAIHMSFIAGTPGAPPIPGTGNRRGGEGSAG